uniref:Rho guanine nucleotide exchange factor 39 n=1 Tax=Salvator merianae TaxID=96440 RepID=A0A8D0DMN7_SALMN
MRGGTGRRSRPSRRTPSSAPACVMSAEQPLPGILEEQRGRWERKRCRTAKELLESEQRYLDRLGLVVTYFVAILKAKGTLRPPEQQTIFGRLEPLYSASRILITHLEKGHLTSGLEHLRHHLVLYLHYAENLEKAQKSLEVVFSSLSGVFVGTGILLVPHRTIRGLVRSATRSAGCVLDSCFQLLGTWDSPGFGITEERRVPGSHWAAFLLLDLQKQLRTNKSFGRFKKLQESRPELQGCRLEDLLALPLRRLRQGPALGCWRVPPGPGNLSLLGECGADAPGAETAERTEDSDPNSRTLVSLRRLANAGAPQGRSSAAQDALSLLGYLGDDQGVPPPPSMEFAQVCLPGHLPAATVHCGESAWPHPEPGRTAQPLLPTPNVAANVLRPGGA